MELPDFDTLRRLALTDPARLDELLQQQIAVLLARVSPEHRQRLRGLQFRIDCQRQLASNDMDSCIRIASMMHDAFYTMSRELGQLGSELSSGTAPVEQVTPVHADNVISLGHYARRKK